MTKKDFKDRLVYWNGKFIPETEARVSIYDSSLMFGDQIFEMTRSFNKKHFKLQEHLERLFVGIKTLEIPFNMSIRQVKKAVETTAKLNLKTFEQDDEHRMLIAVSRGLLPIYADNIQGADKGTNLIIADFPLKWTVAKIAPLFDCGIHAVIPSQRAIPARLLDPKIKNRSRIHYQMANIQVSQLNLDNAWALLVDEDGFITEGCGSNFFIIKNNVVISPEGRNILRGISREYIFELCKAHEIAYQEKNIEFYDIITADEAFMTATPFCILPVTKINGSPIGSGQPGKKTNDLLNFWSFNVGVNIKSQIQSWHKPQSFSPYQFVSQK